jgi:hypothetical protein
MKSLSAISLAVISTQAIQIDQTNYADINVYGREYSLEDME